MRFNPTSLEPTGSGGVAVAPTPAIHPLLPNAAPATLASPAKSGLKKISFAKPAKKAETKTEYPVFSDPANPHVAQQVVAIAARIKERADKIDSLTGAQETDKLELKTFVMPFYFKANRGKAEVPSSISIPVPAQPGEDGKMTEAGEVLVTYQNRYAKLESDAALIPLLGGDLEKYFKQAFQLTIKGELLPLDKAQDIVNELQEVLQRHNALDALDVKEEIKPVKDFHTRRHTVFSPEQNMALDAACPIVAMIKTKGRDSK